MDQNCYWRTLHYLDTLGETDFTKFVVRQRGEEFFYGFWDYEHPMPTNEELKNYKPTDGKKIKKKKDKIRDMLTLQVLDQNEIDELKPIKGMLLYNNTKKQVEVFDGAEWSLM